MHYSAWRQNKIPRKDLSCFDLILLIIQVKIAILDRFRTVYE